MAQLRLMLFALAACTADAAPGSGVPVPPGVTPPFAPPVGSMVTPPAGWMPLPILASAAKTLHAEVPAGAIGADGVLELDFQTTPAASPHSAGLSEDGRKPGIGLATLAITTEGRAR